MRSANTLLALAFVSCVSAPIAQAHGFKIEYDPDPLTAEQYEHVWSYLADFFGAAMPEQIAAQKFNSQGGTSQFDPTTNPMSVKIDAGGFAYPQYFLPVLAHESTHLGNFRLTMTDATIPVGGENIRVGFSMFNQFRFIDEGFANIMGYETAGTGDAYKKRAFTLATLALQEGNLSLTKAEHWRQKPSFPGEPGVFVASEPAFFDLYEAYEVGSSFIYYLQSLGGRSSIRAFLAAAGQYQDLGKALVAVFPKNFGADNPIAARVEAQKGWENFIRGLHMPIQSPKPIAMLPANNSVSASCYIDSLTVEFDQPMDPTVIALNTNHVGQYGISGQNAEWVNDKTLKIAVTQSPLPADTDFELMLGYQDAKRFIPLRSALGIPYPLTSWHFSCSEN